MELNAGQIFLEDYELESPDAGGFRRFDERFHECLTDVSAAGAPGYVNRHFGYTAVNVPLRHGAERGPAE